MIDTHTHLYDEAFDADFRDAVSRATEAGVERFVFPGIDSSVHDRMIKRAEELDGRAAVASGLHPTSIGMNWKEELGFVEKKLSEGGYSAVGEIGLDTYWSSAFVKEQTEAFITQMKWAYELSLPSIIHIRNAHDILFGCLEELRKSGTAMKGVFHAFSGSAETYMRLKTYGDFMFGIGGVITYKKAGIADTVKTMSLDDIVTETDSPWLTPVPHRGQRNEPAFMPLVIGKIAFLKDCPASQVDKTTSDNAARMFNLNNNLNLKI